MTQYDITTRQYKVTLADGEACIVDHFWIAVIDGQTIVAGQHVKTIEKV